MAAKAGTLLWSRQRITLVAGVNIVDTGLQQVGQGFENQSIGEPPLGVVTSSPGPADGSLPASRIQVVPMSPIPNWTDVTHGEPFVNTATGRISVAFNNATSPPVSVEVNVLFWDPHSLIGPGHADTYHA